MATQVSKQRKFIVDGVSKAELNELYLAPPPHPCALI